MTAVFHHLTLCADDYGLTPGISAAIRDLIAQGRLQATSCMTISPHWPQAARDIQTLRGRADIGLHLTLTDQHPLGPMPDLAPEGRFPPLGTLLKRAVGRRIDRAEIARELNRQFDAFVAAFGAPPDFLDGHHHVHELPGIGAAVAEIWRQRMNRRGWIRNCAEPWTAILRRGVSPLRAIIISGLGLGFARRLRRDGVPHNASFRGVYDFSGKIAFADLFNRFTASPGPRCLMMVHPGIVDDALRGIDSLTDQREVEYRYLASDRMVLSAAGRRIALGRLSAALGCATNTDRTDTGAPPSP